MGHIPPPDISFLDFGGDFVKLFVLLETAALIQSG